MNASAPQAALKRPASASPPTAATAPSAPTAPSACADPIAEPPGFDFERLHALPGAERRRVARGTALFRKGETFAALFIVWAGSFKLCAPLPQGQAQVIGFAMRGDWIGLEGIAEGVHMGEALALEDSQVWVLPFDQAQAPSETGYGWWHLLHGTMSRELVRRQAALLLAHRSAKVRVAAFLLDLSDRAAANGYSPTAIVLRMTRSDIGSCLGLSLETVSRTFSSLQTAGLLQVNSRQLRISDAAGLQRLRERAVG